MVNKVIDPAPIFKHLADRCLESKGLECSVLGSVIDMLKAAPAVDAQKVVHGRWEQVQKWATKAKYRCSVCGREIMSATKVNIEKYPYCHCGAKMDAPGVSE